MRRMLMSAGVVAMVLVAGACTPPVEPPAPAVDLDTTIASMKAQHDSVMGFVVAAAAKVPEEMYSFQPNPEMPEVRTMGQLFGHVADANAMFCGMASGMPTPEDAPRAEELTTKAEIEAALDASVAFCETAYPAVTSANGAETMDVFGTMNSRVGVLGFNNGHNNEHYGNIVTYMRINGLVPPSTSGGM